MQSAFVCAKLTRAAFYPGISKITCTDVVLHLQLGGGCLKEDVAGRRLYVPDTEEKNV
jgi:hypothetical protein